MSKILSPISPVFASLVLILQFFTIVKSQDIEVRIKISGDLPSTPEIEGKFLSSKRKDPRNLSFLTEYGGVTGLGERIGNLGIWDDTSRTIPNKRFIAGEYVATADFTNWRYNVDLAPQKQPFAAAHISWIKDGVGVLMLDDLLPQGGGRTAKVKIDVPNGWTVGHTELQDPAGVFTVSDIEKSVFYIGRSIREQEIRSGNYGLKVSISGEWLFSDTEAAEMVKSIFLEYERLLGRLPNTASRVRIMKFPVATGTGNWEADTRGRSVTIVSSDMPFKSQSLQRLHEQLRHELLHLWIPNGVYLRGNYDWFYEGFAVYQSLKTGVAVNQLRFDDLLDTLSRAYDIDSMQAKKLPLIEASKNRWSGSNTQVYARGMLVAFLCDLALLENSKGKRSVTALLREIFEKHRPPGVEMDGNTAVIEALRNHRELVPIVERYIIGADAIDWTALINGAGIEAESKDQLTRLKVTAKPTSRQKDLLDKLGYNNWRKLSESNR